MLPATPAAKKALFDQARSHRAAGRTAAAMADIQRLLLSEPNRAELHLELSHAAFDHGDTELSLSALETALSLAPKDTRLWMIAAARYQRLNRPDAALAALDKASALDPKALAPKVEKAHYLQILGDFEAADRAFRALLKRHPEETEIYRMALVTRKLGKGDPLIRQMLALWTNPRLNDYGRVEIGFALAKAMADIGAQDKVFGFLRQANAAQRRLAPYDSKARRIKWQADLASQDDLPASPLPLPEEAAQLPRPVFVCGMPRSGTTLVEQIIAAHSTATAGGEMGHAMRLAVQLLGQDGNLPRLADLPPARLQDWAMAYRRLSMRDTGAKTGVITDKSMQTHRIFGLIHHALPGVRLIVVHRDPRDIALSIYRNRFKDDTHRYGNDLADIADEIRLFKESVAYWKARLPGVIHEIRYEHLVSDPEPQARALIAAAGLDWEPGCLSFHESKGAVQTLSLAQVRQPIHAGRRAAWMAFESDMQPFIDAWGDTGWD